MNESFRALANQLEQLAEKLPLETAQRVAQILYAATPADAALARARAFELLNQPDLRDDLERLFEVWSSVTPRLDGGALAMALLSVAESERKHRAVPTLDLVWTGPSSQYIPLRRTDQVLLQLIQEAQHRLLLVSFAAYNIRATADALAAAAARGVQLTLCLESPYESEGRITYDNLRAFGAALIHQCKIYTWSLEKRPRNADGKPAALHAKFALADGQTLLLSSANLTEYALQLNMELGLLIRGGEIPQQVDQHFQELIRRGELKRFVPNGE